MTQHPLSKAFPAMPSTEYQTLLADIEKHGQRDPITVYDGMILDGWHRYQCLEHLGIEPVTRQLPEGEDPVAFVISRNLHRRHLTASQRAVAVVQCGEWKPPHRERVNPVHPSAKRVEKSNAEYAKDAEVSERTIQDAKKVVSAGKVDEIYKGASVKSIARPTPAKALEPEPEPEEDAPDLQGELEQAHRELDQMAKTIESLQSSDLAKEVKTWAGKYHALNGSHHQICATNEELTKTATYHAKMFSKIRAALGVEKNSEILDAIKALKG